MTLGSLRRTLYRSARVLGDVSAVEHGPTAVARRAERKLLWRAFARLLRSLGR